jgi:hypothetical protein
MEPKKKRNNKSILKMEGYKFREKHIAKRV